MDLVSYEWRYRAACAGQWAYPFPTPEVVIDDPDGESEVLESFFPPRSKGLYAEVSDFGKSFCKVCTVKNRCLWEAISTEEQHGIWGGYSHRERNAIVRKWQRQYSKTVTLKKYVLSLGG